jgi:hypothetical protein
MAMGVGIIRLPKDVLETLLSELCIDQGHCLSPDGYAGIRSHLPTSIDAFTDAILAAEAPYPSDAMRREVRKTVAKYFESVGEDEI